MDIRSFLTHVVQLEIRIRKAINTQMHGNFSSVFKGSGLEFSDLRQYQYGDDVRHIDWNTSAKGHGTFIKLFKEEKEQNVFFLLDVSASGNIGRQGKSKSRTMKEVSAVLALSAMKEASHIGFCCYSDKNEKFMAPAAGKKHGFKAISELFKLEPENKGTDLKGALMFVMHVLKRRSLIFVLSDFIDTGYEDMLKAAANKHDLVIIHVNDQQELSLPSMGIVPILDPERNKITWVNTSAKGFRKLLHDFNENKAIDLKTQCKKWRADYVSVKAGEDYVPSLVKLFNTRN
jgi:uncharacterized protein (DUF58 family)